MYNLLDDLSIVEVSSFVASPTAGLYCAQLGAEVIRVDHKAGGLDYNRYMLTREGRSLSWENLNRAKKSVALDLQSPEGRELLVELAAKVGQCITNLPEQSFLSHAAMQTRRADMISLRVMGWHDGRQAMDFTRNAAAGYPLVCGPEDWAPATAPPVDQVLPAWDFITGAYGAFAMLASVGFLAILATWEGAWSGWAGYSATGWAAVIFIGVSSGIGYFGWLWALRHASPTRVTVFLGLSPVTAALLGALLLAEPVTLPLLLGLAVLLAGLWLAHRPEAAAK